MAAGVARCARCRQPFPAGRSPSASSDAPGRADTRVRHALSPRAATPLGRTWPLRPSAESWRRSVRPPVDGEPRPERGERRRHAPVASVDARRRRKRVLAAATRASRVRTATVPGADRATARRGIPIRRQRPVRRSRAPGARRSRGRAPARWRDSRERAGGRADRDGSCGAGARRERVWAATVRPKLRRRPVPRDDEHRPARPTTDPPRRPAASQPASAGSPRLPACLRRFWRPRGQPSSPGRPTAVAKAGVLPAAARPR